MGHFGLEAPFWGWVAVVALQCPVRHICMQSGDGQGPGLAILAFLPGWSRSHPAACGTSVGPGLDDAGRANFGCGAFLLDRRMMSRTDDFESLRDAWRAVCIVV